MRYSIAALQVVVTEMYAPECLVSDLGLSGAQVRVDDHARMGLLWRKRVAVSPPISLHADSAEEFAADIDRTLIGLIAEIADMEAGRG